MHEIDKHQFGAFIASLRKEKHLTQKELAQMLFISDKAVSKWETGVSIPDVSLLIPLGEALGVSVTELLECRRMEHSEAMTPVQVEQIVQTAISLNDEEPREKKHTRIVIYAGCILGALMEFAFLWYRGITPQLWSDALSLSLIFGIVFGGYFMIFADTKLPPYHDQYRINGMMQGAFRMNIPGLSFNNRNWPHILTVGRVWSMTFLVGYPLVYYWLISFVPGFWARYEKAVMLMFILGGLFIPMYYVGKKYE